MLEAMTAQSSVELSLAEWAAMPEDEPGELVDAHLVEEEVPDCIHEIIVASLVAAFHGWLRGKKGIVMGSEAKFALQPRRGRKPDVSVYLPGSRKPPMRGVIPIPPDIAVEVVSSTPRDSRRDRVEKVADYAAFGVHWYWIVDPELRILEILELGADGRYVVALSEADRVIESVPGCPGLQIDLPGLWQEIEDAAAEAERT
jgi:Uma2 family endonuclease